jgi:hypothetical protein
VRLAAAADRIHGAGAEVIAISVDDEVRQAGMFERWPTPNVCYVSDRGGERYLRALDLYDPEERDGIALPAMLVITAEGSEVYRYRGRDFADRTSDEDVYAALDELGLDAIEPPVGGPQADVPDDLRGFFRPTDLGAYFRGNRFGAVAIAGRVSDPEARAVARQHRMMADATLDAWKTLR